ncbi:hypothetical protein BAE44_0015511 [Dichanthelium oligosanthes]|uniref:RNase H type-1 domain-containing protein n=1 Tax=Dichanthelium oligosanthes TaxID=888268 RepID=A0A1E5VEB1_9POAL|nr:hypothetical protein BAE44_0015511 [Dichanthelium oligosanthes]
MTKIKMESDANVVCTALCSSQFDKAPIGVLLREIKFQMFVSFVNVRVKHCPRACNFLAHNLAGVGANLTLGGVLLWLAAH